MKQLLFLVIFLSVFPLCLLAQVGGDYDPANPSDPGSPTFMLSLEATPKAGGRFNKSSLRLREGETCNLRAYPNSGYVFVAWLCKGDTLSKSPSFTYTMPNHKETLTGVFAYDPANPSDPQEQALKYHLILSAEPKNSGSFNFPNDSRVEAGSIADLYAYNGRDFVFKHWAIGDSILSSNNELDFLMPSHDVHMTGIFEYNPANPANPNANLWDKETGEVIVDDFTSGYLYRAVHNAIGDSDYSDVLKITVIGQMGSNDFVVANDFANCQILDLSRVTGITSVPSYAFDYTNLSSILLPASIEKIAYRAFSGCGDLRELTVYALTPPALGNYVFDGVPEDLVIYVPSTSLSLYLEADGWSDYTLLPVTQDVREITISLPEDVEVADYAQMWLELVNTKNGQRIHYVMTDRQSYTFTNIIRNTSWNIVLRNQRGDVFGQLKDVKVEDDDVSVVLSDLSKPQNVTLKVLDIDNNDATEQTKITWTDSQGSYIAQGSTVTKMPSGSQLSYSIVLDQNLAMKYNAPERVDYVIEEGDNNIVCHLSSIPLVRISGLVKDASTGLALSEANVSASQTFGGKYGKTISGKTDKKGRYDLQVAKVPTSLAVAASEYISQTVECDSLIETTDSLAITDFSLKPLAGASIAIGFTYTTCDGETQNWLSEYNNIDYTIYNETKQQAVNQFNVQYPQIVLIDEVEDNDVLRLKATSRNGAFKAVEATDTVSDQKASVVFNIVELGKLRASFSKTDNAMVVGTLYDASGKFIKTYNYNDATLLISDLADGRYTLVSMGNSELYNTIYDLSQLSQTGLAEGTDYLQHTVDVKDGEIAQIDIDEVPTFDESKLYYTGENTSFTVNKSSIVAGNYLTLTGHLDFKSAYAGNVSNVSLIVDLPESCEFVENSVMVGNSTSSYIFQNNRITIPLARYTDRVRFCIIPTLGGEFAPSALAQFDIDGETITQPIGSVYYTAKDLTISVPSSVAKTSIPVSGTAIGASDIEIYDGNVLVGKTKSLANGSWSTTVELDNPYNLSVHNICAKVTTKNGLSLVSETQSCTYDKDDIFAKTVEMTFYNGWMHKNINVTFDLENQTCDASSYSFYSETDFTFAANLSNNDTTVVKGVTIGVYTNHDGWINLEATYNAKIDRWVAVRAFGSNNLPTGVKVDIDAEFNSVVDAKLYNSTIMMYDSIKHELLDSENDIAVVSSALSLEWEKDDYDYAIVDSLKNDIYNLLGYTYDPQSVRVYEEEELDVLMAKCDSIINDSISIFKDNFLTQTIYELNGLLEGITISNTVGLDEGVLESLGFVKIDKSDNQYIYIYSSSTEYKFVDFSNNIYYEVDLQNEKSPLTRAIRITDSNGDFPDRINAYIQALKEGADRLRSYMTQLASTIDDIERVVDARNGKIADQLFDLDETIISLEKKGASKFLIAPLKLKYNALVAEGALNAKILGWFEKNISTKGLRVGRLGGGAFAVIDIVKLSMDMVGDLNDVIDVYFKIPDPCEKESSKANSLRNSVVAMGIGAGIYYGAQIVSDAAQITLAITGSTAALPSGGTTLSAVGIAIGLAVANVVASEVYAANFKKNLGNLERQINSLKCEDDKCPKCHKKPCECEEPCPVCNHKPCICCVYCNHYPCTCSYCSKCGKRVQFCTCKKCAKCGKVDCTCKPIPEIPPILDPSGYVYEGISSNRLEGVIATCYYKENVEDMYGDLHENIIKWDAEEYAQKNPLFTDEYGMYAWDVPQGLWQVKFEKEGYETTYSDWLPVPPPQLEVNISMTQNIQPNVKNARAYEDAVEIEFDKYMMPDLLTTENITVSQNGNPIEGTIVLLDKEAVTDESDMYYASKVRFNALNPFDEREILLTVNNRVKSYAGVRMQDDLQQTFVIEQEIKQIASDSLKFLRYNEAATLVVQVLPASASKGKNLLIKTSAPNIVSTETEQVTIGEEGTAIVKLFGELPGTASLSFSIEGSDKTAQTMVKVTQEEILQVASPKSSIATGTVVGKGTEIYLSCETEGATIYYTLDGSCPCDETDARKVYDGTPIVINETVTIKAMAVLSGMEDSEVSVFTYTLLGDVNGDGVVNSTDAVAVINWYLGNKTQNFDENAADINEDNEINSTDAIGIINIYLGKSDIKMFKSSVNMSSLFEVE